MYSPKTAWFIFPVVICLSKGDFNMQGEARKLLCLVFNSSWRDLVTKKKEAGGGRGGAERLSLASDRDSIYKNLPDAEAASLLRGREDGET